jgi:hypothetical protein
LPISSVELVAIDRDSSAVAISIHSAFTFYALSLECNAAPVMRSSSSTDRRFKEKSIRAVHRRLFPRQRRIAIRIKMEGDERGETDYARVDF